MSLKIMQEARKEISDGERNDRTIETENEESLRRIAIALEHIAEVLANGIVTVAKYES